MADGPTMAAASKNTRHTFFLKFALYLVPLYVFSLFQTHTHTQKAQKTYQSLLILSSSPRTQGIAFAPNLLFLGSTLGIWGLGCGCSTHAHTHTHKPQKTYQSLLILSSSPRTQGIAFAPNLLFLGSTLGIWGLGCGCSFFSYHPHP